MPGLSTPDARQIASAYDLSGGEIENIVRKHMVSSILTGKKGIDIDEIMTSCRQERLDNSQPKVGF